MRRDKMKPKYNMTLEENVFVAKRNLVDYIWKSANLDGIRVTYPDTQAICNGMSVAGHSIEDINEVNDLKHAWQFTLANIQTPLDMKYIKEIHRILCGFTVINAGSIRWHDVSIGGTDWQPEMPDEEKVSNELSAILSNKTDMLDTAMDIMLYLMRCQLFYDGNKRLAMLIANKIIIENGMGILSVPQKEIPEFNKLLMSFYETNSVEELKRFLYDKCIDGICF